MVIRKIDKNKTSNPNYWNDIEILQNALNNKEEVKLSNSLKKDIAYMIENSLTEHNYLVAKLLIYGQVTKSILMNFLFYVSVNTKIMYNLFLDNPDKFCGKFMFNITPNELPKLRTYFTEDEAITIEGKIDLENKFKKIKNITNGKLELLFPKSFRHNIKTNPYLKENTL